MESSTAAGCNCREHSTFPLVAAIYPFALTCYHRGLQEIMGKAVCRSHVFFHTAHYGTFMLCNIAVAVSDRSIALLVIRHMHTTANHDYLFCPVIQCYTKPCAPVTPMLLTMVRSIVVCITCCQSLPEGYFRPKFYMALRSTRMTVNSQHSDNTEKVR